MRGREPTTGSPSSGNEVKAEKMQTEASPNLGEAPRGAICLLGLWQANVGFVH
jgi:hypothetical protein